MAIGAYHIFDHNDSFENIVHYYTLIKYRCFWNGLPDPPPPHPSFTDHKNDQCHFIHKNGFCAKFVYSIKIKTLLSYGFCCNKREMYPKSSSHIRAINKIVRHCVLSEEAGSVIIIDAWKSICP